MKTTKALFGVLAITAALAVQVQAQSFLTNGLVAYYPFNGNANDASGNGNNGVTVGSTNTFGTDRFNQNSSSLILSNGAFFDCGILLDPSATNYTESCWINSTEALESSTSDPPYRRIYFMTRRTGFETGADDGMEGGWAGVCINNDGLFNLRLDDAYFFYDSTVGDAPTNAVVLDGQWHQLVGVVANGTYALYLDGLCVVNFTNSHVMLPSDGTRHFWLGSSVYATLDPSDVALYKGRIDDVRIYNRALCPNEVAQLYAYESVPPLSITTQPQSTTNNTGDNVTFSVASTNNVPLTYQWYFDNNPVNNATNSSLTISNVWQVNVGDYFAVVSDWSGSVTSSVASLIIVGVPEWINNGLVAYYPFNGNANDATGNGHDGTVFGSPLTWVADRFGVTNAAAEFDGQDNYITLPSLDSVVPTTSQSMTVSFWAKANTEADVISKYYNLDANDSNFAFILDPANGGLIATGIGIDKVSLSLSENSDWSQFVVVFESGPNNTEIFQDGQLLGSGTVTYNSIVTSTDFVIGRVMGPYPGFANGVLDDLRIYNLALSSDEVAQLYAYETGTNPPSITGQPQSLAVNAHDTASFGVTTYGAIPLSFQWSLNGTNISGATSSSLTISNVSQSDLGTYVVVVTNEFGSVASSNATLSMYPFLAVPFRGVVTDWGKDATLSVQAWGTGPLSYQWFDNGAAILNATNQTFTLTSIQFTNAGLYSVVVSSPLGSVTNTPEQVVVNPAGVSLGLYAGVTVSGVVGYTYIIQSTTDLSNTNSWVTVATLTLEEPIQLWVDISVNASLPLNSYRFYRVLPGP